MPIQEYLKTKGSVIDQYLDQLIPRGDCLPTEPASFAHLFAAARYSLLNGGKRIRPILTLATAEMFGCEQSKALGAASALEIIHTYSLIHDDLPCMDNDDFRRGQPTLHKIYSEGHAVLTGDFLLTHAFSVIANDPFLHAQQKISLIAILTERAGANGMIGGQVMDISSFGKEIDLATLQQIHRYKTAALISAAIEFGGIVANISDEILPILKKIGFTIGLAFQIVDDILDVTSSVEKHGRTVASDLLNDKMSYPSLLGIEASQVHADALLQSAVDLLSSLPYDSSVLSGLATFIVKRKI